VAAAPSALALRMAMDSITPVRDRPSLADDRKPVPSSGPTEVTKASTSSKKISL
jgi:hypothetical protein